MITSDRYGGDAAMSQDEGRERGIGHTWNNPPGGCCLTCMTGWNTRQGEGKCPYPLERRFQEIADRDEGVDMRLSPDLARWLLDRLRTPTAEPSEPVGWAAYLPDDEHESPGGGILLEGMTGGRLLAYDGREVAEKVTGHALPLYAHPVPEDPESAVDQ